MNHALRIACGISMALGLLWTMAAATAQGAGGLAVVGLLLVIYPVFGVLVASWLVEQGRL